MLEEYLWENGHVCAYKGLQGGGKEMWWMKGCNLPGRKTVLWLKKIIGLF